MSDTDRIRGLAKRVARLELLLGLANADTFADLPAEEVANACGGDTPAVRNNRGGDGRP